MNYLADLAELDEQLRRVGRNDEYVGVRLDQDAGFPFVGFAQAFARFNGFGHALFKVGGIADAGAVGADAAKIRQTVGFGGLEAIERAGQHQGKCVFAGAAWSGKDERMRKPLGSDALAQMRDSLRTAKKILKAHELSLEHRLVGVSPQPVSSSHRSP